MTLHTKRFDELSREELYAILRLRVSVFVVEQHCPYMETDDRDQGALHVWLEDENGIEAYLRVLGKGVACEHALIGRVIAVKRRQGLGSRIVREGVRAAREQMGADIICVEAQSYAAGMYEKQGFRRVSEEYLLDGIPHVTMLLE